MILVIVPVQPSPPEWQSAHPEEGPQGVLTALLG